MTAPAALRCRAHLRFMCFPSDEARGSIEGESLTLELGVGGYFFTVCVLTLSTLSKFFIVH